MSNIFNKNLRLFILGLLLIELLSFSGYLWPLVNTAVFFLIVGVALAVSLYRLEYGLLIVLAELFIGSKGYLFFIESGGTRISIRIALWLVILAVWKGKLIIDWVKCRKFPTIEFFRSRFAIYYLVLFFFVGIGLINGYFRHNGLADLFFDFNNWLYLALVFPVFTVFMKGDARFLHQAMRVFVASSIWLAIKTFFLLYIFSHNLIGLVFDVYRWVRETGVGEITLIQGGFYRIFFQSHIYTLVLFLIMLFWLINKQRSDWQKNKNYIILLLLTASLLIATNLMSFSRSNWIGLIAGLGSIGFIYLINKDWKNIAWLLGNTMVTFIFALLMIVAVVKFPFPDPLGGFSTTSLLSERVGQLTGEAGVSSRWSLLPPLWQSIKERPFLGSGFGQTVTYISQDPRVQETNPKGEYTTYAFEWGWLDIWLKLGFFGLLSYLVLTSIIIFKSFALYKNDSPDSFFALGLSSGLLAIMIISFFSPYMNHPLGLGFMIFTTAWLEKMGAFYPHLR